MKNIIFIVAVSFMFFSCRKNYECVCKYSDKTTKHMVEASNKYDAIAKCHSADGKCRYDR